MSRKRAYYAVTGENFAGIFSPYAEAKRHTRGIRNVVIRSFLSQEAAEYYLRTGKIYQYYVVRRGRVCGIFAHYDDFRQQVYQYSGAIFDKFDWLPFAKSYYDAAELTDDTTAYAPPPEKLVKILDSDFPVHPNAGKIVPAPAPPKPPKKKTTGWNWEKLDLPRLYEERFQYLDSAPQDVDIEIYTDGSAFKNWYGWAYVVFWQEHIIYEASGGGRVKDSKHAALIGEIEAVRNAIIWAEMNRFHEARIVSDSQSVLNILTRQYQPKPHSVLWLFYTWLYERPLKQVEHFAFVKGHAGTLGNMLADYFAEIGRLKIQNKRSPLLELHNLAIANAKLKIIVDDE